MRLPKTFLGDRPRCLGQQLQYQEKPVRCRCLIVNQRPTCNFTFDAQSRASGTTQMTRVPEGGSVAFQSCGVWMDNNNVTSTTCFRVSPDIEFLSESSRVEIHSAVWSLHALT